MNLRDFFYGQIVSQAQMDEVFNWAEDADHALAEEMGLTGIASGLVVSQSSPASMSVALTGPGLAYDKNGNRAYISATTPTLSCAVDEYGVSTSVVGGANEKYLSVFVRFKRRLTDPEIDGAGLQVYTRRWEDAEVFLRQGTEAAIGFAARPALLADALLCADVRIVNGTTQILNAAITVTRREDWSRVVTTNYGTQVAGTAKASVAALWAAVDSAASGSGPFTFTSHWFGGVPVGGTATVAGALNEIVSDLHDPGGSGYVGTANFASTYVTWTTQSVAGALTAVATAINGHIGGSAPQHPATAITRSAYSWLAAITVDAAFTEIVDDLASTTSSSSGARCIGAEANTGAIRTLTAGTLYAQLDHLLDQLDGINNLPQLITGEWGMNGRVVTRVHETCGWNRRIAEYPSNALNHNYSNAFPAVHYPTKEAVLLGLADCCDVVPIIGNDASGRRIFGVGVGSLGQFIHWFDPGYVADGVIPVAVTGLVAGVTEVTAACSDGISIFVLVRRGAGADTVAKINPLTGAVVWEQNLHSATSLAGYPFDRIRIGHTVIANSPWTTNLIILNGNLDGDESGVIQQKRSDTGAAYGWGDADGGSDVTGRKPGGGLALVTNSISVDTVIGFTTRTAAGTLRARLSLINGITGAVLTSADMATGGTLVDDEAYDLESDGGAFWWVSRTGYLRFVLMPDASLWGATISGNVGTTMPVLDNGFSLCFDGVRLWLPCFDDTDNRIRLMAKVAARLDTDYVFINNPYTAIILTNMIGTAWTPYASAWQMGRCAVIGPHLVILATRPGGSTRNWAITVHDVHTRPM